MPRIALACAALAALFGAACDSDAAAARASYDRYRRPDALVAALRLRPGDHVADVGAGTGYLEPRLLAAVGASGHVVATDVDERALQKLRRRAPGVETRVVAPDDPSLEAGAYDLILLAEVDHLLLDRAAYFAKLRRALGPGGRLAVSNRVPYRSDVLDAAARAGFRALPETAELPGQFLLLFEVPQ